MEEEQLQLPRKHVTELWTRWFPGLTPPRVLDLVERYDDREHLPTTKDAETERLVVRHAFPVDYKSGLTLETLKTPLFPAHTKVAPSGRNPLELTWSALIACYKPWSLLSRYLCYRQAHQRRASSTTTTTTTSTAPVPLAQLERLEVTAQGCLVLWFSDYVWVTWPRDVVLKTAQLHWLKTQYASWKPRKVCVLATGVTRKVQEATFFQVFTYEYLSYFIFDHELVPECWRWPVAVHTSLPPELRAQIPLLPRIFHTDPVVQALGARVGELIESRPRKRYFQPTYRQVVVRPKNQK
jgi:DNA-directed RNA polymerase subunit H (RpoH/RPB5)